MSLPTNILVNPTVEDQFELYHPKAVIHFAGLAYVGDSFRDPLRYYRTNTAGTITILEAMLANGTKEIVFSSSCTTYGVPEILPISETAKQSPISPYGRSMLACEQVVKDLAAALGIQFVIFDTLTRAVQTKTESYPRVSERHSPETHLIPLAIDAATGQGPPLEIYGADYPTSERDFVHVSDLASAHVDAIGHLNRGSTSLELNLGSLGQAYSLLQV